MRQEFIEKLQRCGSNKDKLSSLMADIDAEKRSLKSYLSRLSSEPDGAFGKGRERQALIRRIKDKRSFLIEEREAIRHKLGSIKVDIESLNKASNRGSVDFAHAFVAAAERNLSKEVFLELELKAADILSVD